MVHVVRGKDLAAEKVAEVKALCKYSTYSQRQIARITGVSNYSASKISREDSSAMNRNKRKGRCGRKRKLTATNERFLLRQLNKNRKSTCSKLQTALRDVGPDVSKTTVWRTLKRRNCKSVKPRRVPLLTRNIRARRLEFARSHSHWTAEDWKKVAFSDESMFQCERSHSLQVWHSPNHPRPVQQRVKHPEKVMVWGIMSAQGAGRLHVCEGMMNKEKYLHVLRSRVVPQMMEWLPNGDGTFMHDSAPCHSAKICKEFLRQSNIPVLRWPGNLPDLNPIETLWGIIKRRLSEFDISSKKELIHQVIKLWHRDCSISETCSKLIASMPDRIKAVIQARGGHTKF